jgi:hypothetical protein
VRGVPANDVPTLLAQCEGKSAKMDWTYVQPGDNSVIQLTGTNLCVSPSFYS